MNAIILDSLIPSNQLAAVRTAWPSPEWVGWHDYGETRGGKRASRPDATLPLACGVLLARLAALPVATLFPELPPLVPDLSLWGSGLHEMPAGPGLPRHLDADTHPRLGLARVLSAVLYVHDQWLSSWGGELAFSSGVAVLPAPGRLVIFDCREESHWVHPVQCSGDQTRKSLALFWYAAKAGPNQRLRADFSLASECPG